MQHARDVQKRVPAVRPEPAILFLRQKTEHQRAASAAAANAANTPAKSGTGSVPGISNGDISPCGTKAAQKNPLVPVSDRNAYPLVSDAKG